jgi:hypothetical protein
MTLLIKRDPNAEPFDPLDVVNDLPPRWVGRALEFYDVKLSQRFEAQLDRFERAISGVGARSLPASFANRHQPRTNVRRSSSRPTCRVRQPCARPHIEHAKAAELLGAT